MNKQVSPRDMASLRDLTAHGLSLVEVKISQVSVARGMAVKDIVLPENSRVLCVVPPGQSPILQPEDQVLAADDVVYLITNHVTAVREALTACDHTA
jgi:hypothetical protein